MQENFLLALKKFLTNLSKKFTEQIFTQTKNVRKQMFTDSNIVASILQS